MNNQDRSPLADRPEDLLRLLPARASMITRRLERFTRSGWDINGLALIHADVSRLGAASAAQGLDESAEPLLAIATLLAEVLAQEQLPDPELGERLRALARTLDEVVPRPPVEEIEPVPFVPSNLAEEFEMMNAADARAGRPAPVIQADDLTDHWGDGVALFGQSPESTAGNPESTPGTAREPATVAPATPASASASSTKGALSTAYGGNTALVVPSDFRIYHLTGHGALSLELDQRIEAQGLEIELLEDIEELNELLSALPADLVLVDANFSAELEGVGAAVRLARARNSKQRLLLVAITQADDIGLRLSARRAGVDALVVDPANVTEVLKRLQALLDPKREDPFRILIVEDDRSQALFAEGILRNAEMDSLVVLDALDVMPAMLQFRPDLILMDLNMPGANGIELTALIREQEAYAHTPIVFLSGENSDDLQFDAIDAGGDDFLSKPIRPRHLISAVQTRVRRARQQEASRAKRADKDATTGLAYRTTLLQQLDACLHRGQQEGGLIFLEVESMAALRERIGLTALEALLSDVSRLIAKSMGDLHGTRFGDGSFLLLDTRRDEATLDALATQLRHTTMQHQFQALGHPLRLRVSVGISAFRHNFNEAGAMINTVEKVAREARSLERGVLRYEPPRANEALQEAALLAQIREAIDKDSLILHYQPVVAVAGNDVSQYQALLRLRDNNGKLRSAAELIPIAERNSLIVEIDRWVLTHALALIAKRMAEGQQLRLYVTQSPLTLTATGQSEWLKGELAGVGVPGTSLVIELRLDDAVVHAASVHQFCEAMASRRVQFCLSQFEAGSEAEALLSQLPLSFVKLARKYTAGTQTPALRDELKTVIALAHRRGLQVIGHSVEDAQAAATLWMSGIDLIQGNLVQQADQDMNFDFNQAVL